MFYYEKISGGEHLCSYLFENLVDGSMWHRLESKHLHTTGRAVQFRHFFQEALALNMTRRLILAGEHARENFLDPEESGFLSCLDSAISNIGLRDLNSRGKISRLTRDALINSRHSISTRLRTKLLNSGRNNREGCYLCGIALNYDLGPTEKDWDVTLDHLWPQSYGGDSVEENILPACRLCNTKKKQDYASWAACNVHTLIIGVNPSADALKSVGRHFQFALYNRSVTQYANEKKISLKRAYQKIGPWKSVACAIEQNDVGDFFNLTNSH
jgi:hypothetical protein